MNSLTFFLRYARYRYIAHRLYLRMKMGKKKRDEYLQKVGTSITDFLPERPYSINGVKTIPRKGTQDFYMLYLAREEEVKPHLTMYEGETFVDVGANVGSYSLNIANDYKDSKIKVIAIEAHPENYQALRRNVEINKFNHIIITVNKAASDNKGLATMYERIHIDERVRSDFYSLCDTFLHETNFVRPHGKPIQVECDTLDNILAPYTPDVMKIDIEGAEVVALKGAASTLKHLRKIIVEVHGNNFDDVKEILEDNDFRLDTVKGNMVHIIGSR